MNVTFLADIAGRVTRETLNADRVTAAGVAIPSGAVKFIRKRIPANLPKWRDATDTDVELVVDLVLKEALSVSAVSIEKDPIAWEEFWRDAANAHSRTAPISGGKMNFVKAATVIKYAIFGQISSLGMANVIMGQRLPLPATIRRPLFIRETMIFDDEIQGDDNVEVFLELWKARNAHQPLANILGIHQEVVNVSLKTEQEEPLLLLPDYVAGLVHSGNSNAHVLSASKVTSSAAHRLHELIRRSRKYAEIVEPFAYRYHDVFPNFKELFPDTP